MEGTPGPPCRGPKGPVPAFRIVREDAERETRGQGRHSCRHFLRIKRGAFSRRGEGGNKPAVLPVGPYVCRLIGAAQVDRSLAD